VPRVVADADPGLSAHYKELNRQCRRTQLSSFAAQFHVLGYR
jgi:hypothetical protein